MRDDLGFRSRANEAGGGRLCGCPFKRQARSPHRFLDVPYRGWLWVGCVEGNAFHDLGHRGEPGIFCTRRSKSFPNATIHCYEPNPRILPVLEQNAAAVRAGVFCEAVAVSEGTVFLEESGDSNQVRTTSVVSGGAVPQVSLRTAVERLGGRVDLAKIDCEGAEWEMFGDPEHWKAIQHLRMEYHLMNRHAFSKVHSRLLAFGFEIFHHESSGDWGTVWAWREV
jgi:FkbM family methyltransferase